MDGINNRPLLIRQAANIKDGDSMEIYLNGQTVCLDKILPESGYVDIVETLMINIAADSRLYRDRDNRDSIVAKLKEAVEMLKGEE